MNPFDQGPHAEGLKLARFIMVLSSMSPLFILWGIRGTNLIPALYFVTGCLVMAVLPTAFLLFRELLAKRQNDIRSLVIGRTEDHRGHVLVYLFAILLPFYRQNVDSWREFSALVAALVFIVFLFWHLNYHYPELPISSCLDPSNAPSSTRAIVVSLTDAVNHPIKLTKPSLGVVS